MKYRFLDLLCCPSCGNQLKLDAFEEGTDGSGNSEQSSKLPRCSIYCGLQDISLRGNDAGKEQPTFDCIACDKKEILEGILSCACGNVFPVSSCVPCMLHGNLEAYPEFIAKNKDKLMVYCSEF